MRCNFGDAIKELAILMFCTLYKDIDAQKYFYNPLFKGVPLVKSSSPSGRHFMQTFGTNICREILGNDIWINIWKARVLTSLSDVILTEDLRFKNELKAIKLMHADVIHVIRDDLVYEEKHKHVSETQLDGIEYGFKLYNNKNKTDTEIAHDLVAILLRNTD